KIVRSRKGIIYTLYSLLNPIPFGMFVGALIFDITYKNTGEILWANAASWLVVLGLIIAIIPRLINLFYVWFRPIQNIRKIEITGFFLYGFAIVSGIFNAFIHSRDAYGIVPANVIFSFITVFLISIYYIYESTARNDLED
ncbi:TPA: DUF2231 domain-containing protein, partial [Acinetobacter baumannii]